MASTSRYISPTGFLPEPTGTIVSYVRDPKKFPLNRYCQLVQTPSAQGLYYVLDRDNPVRVVSTKESVWQDGDYAPEGNTNQSVFRAETFRTMRHSRDFRLGEEAVEAAVRLGKWDPIAFESQAVASQMMTERTYDVITALETSGNWGSNTASATTLGGGLWDTATTANPYIKLGLLAAARAINTATNGIVQPNDLLCILNPDDAIEISQTDEILGYMKSSVFSRGNITGELTTNEMWGLPDHIAGIQIVVENAMRVTTRPTSSDTAGTRSLIKSANSAVLVSRPGGLDGAYGTHSWSTVQLYWHKFQMAVEARYHQWHKFHQGRVVDERAVVIPANPSGYLITATTS